MANSHFMLTVVTCHQFRLYSGLEIYQISFTTIDDFEIWTLSKRSDATQTIYVSEQLN